MSKQVGYLILFNARTFSLSCQPVLVSCCFPLATVAPQRRQERADFGFKTFFTGVVLTPANTSVIENPFLTFLHVLIHMITVGEFQSDWSKCNPIKKLKGQRGGKKQEVLPEVFPRGFGLWPKLCRPLAENSHHTRDKPLVPWVLWSIT